MSDAPFVVPDGVTRLRELLREEIERHDGHSPDISYCWWCGRDVNGLHVAAPEPHEPDCWLIRAEAVLRQPVSPEPPEKVAVLERAIDELFTFLQHVEWTDRASEESAFDLRHAVADALEALREPSGVSPVPSASEEVDVQLLAWAVTNCHTLARRALSHAPALDSYHREKWEHIQRICEKAGARSHGVLRASVPTEVTEGSAPVPSESDERKRERCAALHPTIAWETCGRWRGHDGAHRAMGREAGGLYDWTDAPVPSARAQEPK